MLSKKIQLELNKQLNREVEASYKYLAVSAYLDSESLSGGAQWMRAQAKEELEHAQKIYKYLIDCGTKASFDALDKPRANFTSLRDVFEYALSQEKKMSQHLNELAQLSLTEKDLPTFQFLQWFLAEQVEEVSLCQSMLDKVNLLGNDGRAAYLLDRELGTRAA